MNYIKSNQNIIPINDNMILLLSIKIINIIIDDNNNYCLLNKIYYNINKYSKLQNIYLYNNNKKRRNLNFFIKKKYKNVFNFLKSLDCYKIENDIIYKV